MATDPSHRLVVCFGGGFSIGVGANVALVEILEKL